MVPDRQKVRTDVRPILNIRPVYKGPLIWDQVYEITGQFSSELASSYQSDKGSLTLVMGKCL